MPEPSHIDLRIKQLEQQLGTTAQELWKLINPTEKEIHMIADDYENWDQDELIGQILITNEAWERDNPLGWFRAIGTAFDVLYLRQMMKENSDEQTNG